MHDKHCMHQTKIIAKVNHYLKYSYLWVMLLVGLRRGTLMVTRKPMKVECCNVNCNRKWETIMLWYAWLHYLENQYVCHLYVSYVSCQSRYYGLMLRVKYECMIYINVSLF